MAKLFFILLSFYGGTCAAEISSHEKAKIIIEKLAPESEKTALIKVINSFSHWLDEKKIDQLTEVLKYADKADIQVLIKELMNMHWNQNPQYWKMLLRHPKAKRQISLYKLFVPADDEESIAAFKLILDLVDEKNLPQYFKMLIRKPNLKTIKAVLTTPPYSRSPEIFAMAMRLSPEAHDDFIRDLPKIHAGESWRSVLEKKLVTAFGTYFVKRDIKLPDYIVSLNQIAAVETLLGEKTTASEIKQAIRLGADLKSYQYFQAIIKKNVSPKHRNYYWESYQADYTRRAHYMEAILETDHLFFYPDLITSLLNIAGHEDKMVAIKKFNHFLRILSDEKISKDDIEQIVKKLTYPQPSYPSNQIEFAVEVMKAKKGKVNSALIKLAIRIPNNPFHQKAFLLGQEYLSAGELENLTKFLSTHGVISKEGLENFRKMIKKGNMGQLLFSDVLSGKYLHREQAKELINQYAHAEDLKWALEYLEKNSGINRPDSLAILREILKTPSLQRERGLIELAISQNYNTTPLPIFVKAIENLSKEDLKLFMEKVMSKKELTDKENALMIDLILRDPFTASFEPFLKGFLGSKGHPEVIKKEQEIILLARKTLASEVLEQVKIKLKRNFKEAQDMGHELNRLDSIQSALEHSQHKISGELLHNLLDGEHLDDLKLNIFKQALKISHSDDLLKLLQILRKNQITDLKGRIFLALLRGKKSQRNLSLISAAMAIKIPNDKNTLDVLFYIGEEAPSEMAADLLSHLNGVVLNDQQLRDIKKGLKSWALEDIKQSFLHILNKGLFPTTIKPLGKDVSQFTQAMVGRNEIIEGLKTWSLNEAQLKKKIEEAVILARNDASFRRFLLDQILDRDPDKKWRFTKTNHLLRKHSAIVLLKTYEGTSEVSPLMQQLEKITESTLRPNYRAQPHFRFEEENPLVRRALQYFAGGELAPISSCDQIKKIIRDSGIQLQGVRIP